MTTADVDRIVAVTTVVLCAPVLVAVAVIYVDRVRTAARNRRLAAERARGRR